MQLVLDRRDEVAGITTPLIVDATGPGEVYLDFLRGSAIPLVPMNVTSGGNVTGRCNVPKSELVNALAVLTEPEKLGVVREVALACWYARKLWQLEPKPRPSGQILCV